jgi:hypothetical protein
MGRGRRRKVQPTDEWGLLLPLFTRPEQRAYEELRPLVLLGGSTAERAIRDRHPRAHHVPEDRALRGGRHAAPLRDRSRRGEGQSSPRSPVNRLMVIMRRLGGPRALVGEGAPG